ncbi:hypothetical protein [Fischerella sp. PCC 9605]|uniref:hypothetical protein n=1 Tax=Fischerella sp. PCC 9605 TaxID=1173024 RepID=UPI0012DC710A|nr:hypothetical protein [Fischerella sp. PCC 9605]
MKFIVGLSSLALFSLSSVSPCLAANQLVSSSADQSLPSTTKTIEVANSFGSVTQVINTIDRVTQIGNRERARQKRLQRQENFARQRQQRINMYQKRKQERAAAAAARREQERRYFESLTPEQQKEYIAHRRAKQEQQARQMLLMLGVLGAAMEYSNSGASPSSNVNQDRWIVEDRYNRPSAPQPAPAPVAPIGPLYGTGPGGSFYGN